MPSSGVFVIRRLQDDMQYSAGGETFNKRYIWKSLTDWKTWIASKWYIFVSIDPSLTSILSGDIHGIVSRNLRPKLTDDTHQSQRWTSLRVLAVHTNCYKPGGSPCISHTRSVDGDAYSIAR